MSDALTPQRAILDVTVDARGNRIFLVELEAEDGGLVKLWGTQDYVEAAYALRKIAAAAGIESVDAYARGSLAFNAEARR